MALQSRRKRTIFSITGAGTNAHPRGKKMTSGPYFKIHRNQCQVCYKWELNNELLEDYTEMIFVASKKEKVIIKKKIN